MTKITLPTNSYNQRRYSKPWIAVVNFSQNPKGEFAWGDWVGNHNTGSEGLLVIEANEGDIVATGRKDFRNPKHTSINYYQMQDGKLVRLADKVAAYQLAMAH